MSDLKGTPGGEAGQTNRLYHDEGDGTHSESFAAHLRGWDATDGAWYRIPIDHASGALKATLTVGSIDIGIVDQGTGGSSAWKVTDPALADGTQRVGGTVSVTQSTSPWVTNDPGLPDTLGQKNMAGSTGVVIASDQASIPVAATLAVETSKVIGTVNQGTSPWVVSGAVTAADTTFGATVAPKAASVWDVSDRSARLLGHVTVDTAPTTTITAATLPLPTGAAIEVGGMLQLQTELLQQLLIETRIHSLVLIDGLNVRAEPESLRSDPAFLN